MFLPHVWDGILNWSHKEIQKMGISIITMLPVPDSDEPAAIP